MLEIFIIISFSVDYPLKRLVFGQELDVKMPEVELKFLNISKLDVRC
jgi:hypothetical protein